MKIRRTLVRTTKSTHAKFYRHDVTLPADLVEELGWSFGMNVRARRLRDGILIELDE